MLNVAATIQDVRASVRRGLASIKLIDAGILAICVALAIAIRIPLLSFRSSDFFNSLRPWYAAIRELGFSVFATDFTTYNPPYLYELYVIARFFPDISNVLAIKIP